MKKENKASKSKTQGRNNLDKEKQEENPNMRVET
jgi:hypothetical protein